MNPVAAISACPASSYLLCRCLERELTGRLDLCFIAPISSTLAASMRAPTATITQAAFRYERTKMTAPATPTRMTGHLAHLAGACTSVSVQHRNACLHGRVHADEAMADRVMFEVPGGETARRIAVDGPDRSAIEADLPDPG